MGSLDSSLWLYDFVSASTDAQVHAVSEVLVSRKTEYQQVCIYRSPSFGKILTLDGRVQSLELDEFIYHEAFVHPAVAWCEKPRRALIIGGGEGACLRELLRYPDIAEVVMVDIDGELIDIAREHLPTWHQGAFDDPRSRLCFQDARKWVQKTDETFDVIVVDLSEPAPGTPAYFLFTVEFYRMLDKILAPEGVITFQSDAPAIQKPDTWAVTVNSVRQVFRHVVPLVCTVPGFGSNWAFTVAGRRPFEPLTSAEVDARLKQRLKPDELRYYDGTTHQRLLALPKYLRALLAHEARFFSDANPPKVGWV